MVNQELINKLITAVNTNTAELSKLAGYQNKVNKVLNLNTKQIDVLSAEIKELKELANKKKISGFLK